MPRLRWPVLALNTAMLLSTPVEGTHYLIDILLGTIVAMAAIATLHRLMPRSTTHRTNANGVAAPRPPR